MKRTGLTVTICLLLSFSASALGPWSTSNKAVEGYGHVSLSEGTNFASGAAFVWGRQHTKGFFLGAGAGLRYVRSLHEQVAKTDVITNVYGNEAVVPVFIRARFGRVRPGELRPFVTADVGTAVNLNSDGNTKGFFFEPQIGLDLADNVYLTLGVDNHHFLSRRLIGVSDVIGTIRDPEKKVKSIMSTGISLHLGYSF